MGSAAVGYLFAIVYRRGKPRSGQHKRLTQASRRARTIVAIVSAPCLMAAVYLLFPQIVAVRAAIMSGLVIWFGAVAGLAVGTATSSQGLSAIARVALRAKRAKFLWVARTRGP